MRAKALDCVQMNCVELLVIAPPLEVESLEFNGSA